MEFRRNGQRRRRVLMEDRNEDGESSLSDGPAGDVRGFIAHVKGS